MVIPATFQGILWSKGIQKLDLKRDRNYIIHQTLALGTLENIIWLFKTFSKSEILQVFVKYPQKVYTKASLNFTKNILLGLKMKLNEKNYLQAPS